MLLKTLNWLNSMHRLPINTLKIYVKNMKIFTNRIISMRNLLKKNKEKYFKKCYQYLK